MRDFPGLQWLSICLAMQGSQVRSLDLGLRSDAAEELSPAHNWNLRQPKTNKPNTEKKCPARRRSTQQFHIETAVRGSQGSSGDLWC